MRTHTEDCRMLMHCDTALVVLALFAYELRQCAFLCCFALLDLFYLLDLFHKTKKLILFLCLLRLYNYTSNHWKLWLQSTGTILRKRRIAVTSVQYCCYCCARIHIELLTTERCLSSCGIPMCKNSYRAGTWPYSALVELNQSARYPLTLLSTALVLYLAT